MYQTKDPSDKSEPVKTEQTTASNGPGIVVPMNRFAKDRVQFEFPVKPTTLQDAGELMNARWILLRADIIRIFKVKKFLDWIIKLLDKRITGVPKMKEHVPLPPKK